MVKRKRRKKHHKSTDEESSDRKCWREVWDVVAVMQTYGEDERVEAFSSSVLVPKGCTPPFLFAESKTWRSASHGRTRKGAALRRRQRYPRSICRHEQVAIKMAVASAVNHSAERPCTTDVDAHTVSEIVLDIGGESSCGSLSVSALVGDPGVFEVAVTHTPHNPALASRLLRRG